MKTTRRAELIDDLELEYIESEVNLESDEEYIKTIDEEVRGLFEWVNLQDSENVMLMKF